MARDRTVGLGLTLTIAAVLIGCGPTAPAVPQLRVAAASDLQAAMPILASAYRQAHDVEVVATFGASGQLAEQIRQGAPFDVFLSANRGFVDDLAAQGHLRADSVRPYARGTLAIAVNKLSAVKVATLADLSKPEVRKVAIANPETAPYGLAAKQALERAGLWDTLRSKIVPADSVRQALQFVQSGNAEVAIVGRSIGEVREATLVPLPPGSCDPIVQALGVVSRSGRPEDAREFVDFVLSDVGQGILRDLGYRRAGEPDEPPKGVNGR